MQVGAHTPSDRPLAEAEARSADDCSPDLVERTKVPAEGTDAEEIAFEANPRVSRVEVEDPQKLRAEGYDANGEIILVVAFDDIRPETFSIYTCP